MTVNTLNITSGPFAGNDVADAFAYTFRIEDKTEVTVFETDDNDVQTTLVVDTDYTVAGIGVDGGGTITRVAGALPTGFEWFIRSNFIKTQLTDLDSQGGFFPDVHEKALDKLTFLIQQVCDSVDRSPRLSDSYSGPLPLSLPDPEASKVLIWNDALNGFDNIGFPGTIIPEKTEITVESMIANNSLVPGQLVRTVDYYSTQRGGGAPYLVKTTAQATTDGDVIDGKGNHTLVTGDVAIIQPDPTVMTSQYGLKGTGLPADRTNDIAVLDAIFANNTVITLSPGTYPEYKITDPTLTLYSTKDVIFFLPDGTSDSSNTVAKMTLEIAAIDITINGDITVDGNEAGNSRASMNNSDRRGAFAANHDRFNLNGCVIIPTAYWVGYSIGHEGKIAFDVYIQCIRVITASSYNFHAWACDRWKVGIIIVEDATQGFDNRIQTGTELAAATACKNGEIGTIVALNTYCVFEINTVQLEVGTAICVGGKTEDSTNVHIKSFISQDLDITFDANAFTTIGATNTVVDNLTVLNYDGLQEEVVQFSDSSSGTKIGTLTVSGTKERAGNPRNDLVIYGGDDLHIGVADLTGSASVGGHGLFVNNITTMSNVVIESLTSRGHNGNDVHFNQFNDPEVQINKVNSDAVSNASFTENVGTYDEQTVTVALAPQTSGTITLSDQSMTVNKDGRMVTVNGTIVVSTGTPPVAPLGSLRLTGLPFTCFNAKRAESAVTIHVQGLAAGFVGRVEGRIRANTNYIELWRVDNENFFDLSAHIQAATELTIYLEYPVR